jgi:hypothetical protein
MCIEGEKNILARRPESSQLVALEQESQEGEGSEEA